MCHNSCIYQKIVVILQHQKKKTMQNEAKLAQLIQTIDQSGVYVEQEVHGFPFQGIEMVVPHVVLVVCLSGNARALYDNREVTLSKNTMAVILPGHILQPLAYSDDYTYARLAIAQELFEDLNNYVFSHDYDKFHASPACQLTDIQTKRIMAHFELLEAIASHDYSDLHLRRQMLLALLAIAYEFINYYRREQDQPKKKDSTTTVFAEFCDLVTKYYKENRNVNFYAEKLGYEPRYFSKLFFRLSNGITALEWIQQYVASRAKHIMDEHPEQTVKATAMQLGFPTTANFCRYFLRATGIYPQAYKDGKA